MWIIIHPANTHEYNCTPGQYSFIHFHRWDHLSDGHMIPLIKSSQWAVWSHSSFVHRSSFLSVSDIHDALMNALIQPSSDFVYSECCWISIIEHDWKRVNKQYKLRLSDTDLKWAKWWWSDPDLKWARWCWSDPDLKWAKWCWNDPDDSFIKCVSLILKYSRNILITEENQWINQPHSVVHPGLYCRWPCLGTGHTISSAEARD